MEAPLPLQLLRVSQCNTPCVNKFLQMLRVHSRFHMRALVDILVDSVSQRHFVVYEIALRCGHQTVYEIASSRGFQMCMRSHCAFKYLQEVLQFAMA